MWIVLLLLTWGIEGVAGVWFCSHYWTLTEFHYDHSSILGLGDAIVQVWNGLVTGLSQTYTPHRHPSLLTQDGLARVMVVVYVAFHVLSLVRGLTAPVRERQAATEWPGSPAL